MPRNIINTKIENSLNLFEVVSHNPLALKIVELLNLEDPSPTELGHITEIVQDACQGDLSAFASNNKIKQFNRSINHPKVMGLKARHAVSGDQPPPKPMSFEEACLFAKGIGRAWLESLEYKSQ